MKKIITLLVVIVVVALLIPIVGSQMMDKEITKKLDLLKSHGVAQKDSSENFTYFSTSKHYKLIVKDSDKFVRYLQQFSDNKLQSYITDLVDGVVVGVDIKHSNIPYSESISLDIYPLTLSKKFMDEVAKHDVDFHQFIESFLERKALLYHLNYNIIKTKFDGYIKNISESYTIDNDKKITFNLKGSSFNGDGLPMKPDRIDSLTKELSLKIVEPNENINLIFKNILSTASIKSSNTYSYMTQTELSRFEINSVNNLKILAEMKKLSLNISSDTRANKAQLVTKASFEKLQIMNNNKKVSLDGFNYNLFIKDIDKDNYEKLQRLFSESKSLQSKRVKDKMSNIVMKILAKGLEISLVDLSIKNIDYSEEKNLNGFSINSNILITEDADLAKLSQYDQNQVIEKITLDSSLKVSKKVINVLIKEFPIVMIVKHYGKESAEDFVYDIKQKDGSLTINGKSLR